MAIDPNPNHPSLASSPAVAAGAITPNDTDDPAFRTTRGLYVGTSGDLRVRMRNGDVTTFPNLAAGMIHPLSVQQVFATGTTATGIVGVR